MDKGGGGGGTMEEQSGLMVRVKIEGIVSYNFLIAEFLDTKLD